MSQQIALNLPNELVKRLQEVAEQKGHPFESVAIAAMEAGVRKMLMQIEGLPQIMPDHSDEDLQVVENQRRKRGKKQANTP